MADFTFIDLFAGVGGFHRAMEGLGGECVFASEIDPEARETYRRAFPEFDNDGEVEGNVPAGQYLFNRDIRVVTGSLDDPHSRVIDADRRARIRELVPEHDVLCAGFPCQPFSKSGWQRGIYETRGTLFYDILRILEARKPSWAILENVRNLAGPRQRSTWNTIVRQLRSLGYRVHDEPVVLSPHNLPPRHGGAPQVRERVFILCEYVGAASTVGDLLVPKTPFADEWDPRQGWSVARHVLKEPTADELAKARLSADEEHWIDVWQEFVTEIVDEDRNKPDSLPGFPIWTDSFLEDPDEDAPQWKLEFQRKNRDFYKQHATWLDGWLPRLRGLPDSRKKLEWQARSAQPTAVDRDLHSLIYQFRPSGIRVKPPTYLPALVAITQTSVLGRDLAGGQARRITPREAAGLQGLSAEHVHPRWPAAYKQLGNAVNVGAVTFVARALMGQTAKERAARLAEVKALPRATRPVREDQTDDVAHEGRVLMFPEAEDAPAVAS